MRWLLIVSFSLWLATCGQRGPLTLPAHVQQPEPLSATTAVAEHTLPNSHRTSDRVS